MTAGTVERDVAFLPLEGPTPRRVFHADVAAARFAAVARACEKVGAAAGLDVVPAYSVKTNPRAELLALALRGGFLAETISAEEASWATSCGFVRSAIVVNGPEPIARAAAPFAYAFADSIEAFERNLVHNVAQVAGVRLRPSMLTASRFGVTRDEDEALRGLVAASAPDRTLAISFHGRRGDFGAASWSDVAGDIVERAVSLERATGARIVALDLGGGWTPEQFDEVFVAETLPLAQGVRTRLPHCSRLLIEPGQAIATPSESLLARVVEVRVRGEQREAIVDAAYADWPQMHTYRHPILVHARGRWIEAGAGADRLGGRTCLEYDVVDGLRFPTDLAAGDLLAILDTGSYDRSMAFNFARGGSSTTPHA